MRHVALLLALLAVPALALGLLKRWACGKGLHEPMQLPPRQSIFPAQDASALLIASEPLSPMVDATAFRNA